MNGTLCETPPTSPGEQRRPDPPEAGETLAVEYIKSLIEHARNDARKVHLRVTAAIGIALLFVTQLPFERLVLLSPNMTWVLFVGLGAMAVAALGYFFYMSKVQHAPSGLARCLLTADSAGAQTNWQSVWDRNKWAYWAADVALVVGVVCLAWVLVEFVTGQPVDVTK